MATVALVIAGRSHELACRDGEEAKLRAVAAIVDGKAVVAARAMGGMSEARQMLFAALMLADELADAQAALADAHAVLADAQTALALAAAPPDPATAEAIERLADRLERLAARMASPVPGAGLETAPANA